SSDNDTDLSDNEETDVYETFRKYHQNKLKDTVKAKNGNNDIPYIDDTDSSDIEVNYDYATFKKYCNNKLKDTPKARRRKNDNNSHKLDNEQKNTSNNNEIKNAENKDVVDSNNQHCLPKITYKEKTTIIMNFGSSNNESQDNANKISENCYADVNKTNNDNYGKQRTNVTGHSNVNALNKDTICKSVTSNTVPNKPTVDHKTPEQQITDKQVSD
ncbi:hypothetical protein YYC_04147, partial [Plasmodium yoelii 17X]